MSEPTHPFTSRRCVCAAFPLLLVCALVLLSGCLALPTTPQPGVVTVLVEVTRLVPATLAPGDATEADGQGASALATSTARNTAVAELTARRTRSAPPPAAPQATVTPPSGASASGANRPEAPAPTVNSTGQTNPPVAALPTVDSSAQSNPPAPTPDSSGQSNPPFAQPAGPERCEPSDTPKVFALGASWTAPGRLPSICITGFAPITEVDLWVTYPDGRGEYTGEVTNEGGTAVVHWPAGMSFPPGTYTFAATQGGLIAEGRFDVGPGGEPQGPTPEPQAPSPGPQRGQPSIEVYPAGGSGRDFQVVLSGFGPNQEVRLRLYVAANEERTEFDEIDSLSQQVDAQGMATFPLQVTSGNYPSSWYALTYWREDGRPVYAEFQVR